MSLLYTKRENKLKVLIYMQYEYSNAIVHVSSTCLYLPIYLTYMDWIYCLPTEDGYWIIYAYCLHTQGGGVYCIVVLLRVNVFIVHLPKVEIVCCLHAPRWDVWCKEYTYPGWRVSIVQVYTYPGWRVSIVQVYIYPGWRVPIVQVYDPILLAL